MLAHTLAATALAVTAVVASPATTFQGFQRRDLRHSNAWLGCVNPAAAYTDGSFTSASLKPEDCQNACAADNKLYAVVTGGNTCACTNRIADSEVVSELFCTTPCVGDSSVSCGGLADLNYWDVYLTPVSIIT